MSKEARVREAIAKAFTFGEGAHNAIKKDADNVLKFHAQELSEKDIQALSFISKNITVELRIKRSGTGLTVLIFL